MPRKTLQALAGVLAALTFVACEATKSSNPLGPSVAGPIPGVNITAPTPVEPVQGFKIAVESQPVTLTVSNAATNGVRPLNYLFEVATDAGFSNKVFTREGIAPGASGRTQVKLPEALGPERTYYWRARAQDGANTGAFSSAAYFAVFTPVVIGKPIPQDPIGNATVSSVQPIFKFANASRSGPAGPITYELELSETDTFGTKVGVWALDESPSGQTSLACPVALTASKQYFWRVRGFEATTTGPWSDLAAFKTPSSGGGGGGGGGGGCSPNSSKHVPSGAATEQRAADVVNATGSEFPCHLAVFSSEDEAVAQAEQLLLRMIWHLQRAGFQAARQQNPSGLVSKDKLAIFINGGWRAYDVMSLGYAGKATTVQFFEVPLPNPVPDPGLSD
jgi:hypothetical protein